MNAQKLFNHGDCGQCVYALWREDPTFICANKENFLQDDPGEERDAKWKAACLHLGFFLINEALGGRCEWPILGSYSYKPLRWLGMKVSSCTTTETKNNTERDMFSAP